MNGQDQNGWVAPLVKMALSLAVLFPIYALFYVTFPASLIAAYVVSAIAVAFLAPWDLLKKKLIDD